MSKPRGAGGRRGAAKRQKSQDSAKTTLSGGHTVESWNAKHPVGTPVRFWPVYPPMDGIPPEDTTTRSEAWALGHGAVVVLVVGRTGGVCLSHVEPRDVAPEPAR